MTLRAPSRSRDLLFYFHDKEDERSARASRGLKHSTSIYHKILLAEKIHIVRKSIEYLHITFTR